MRWDRQCNSASRIRRRRRRRRCRRRHESPPIRRLGEVGDGDKKADRVGARCAEGGERLARLREVRAVRGRERTPMGIGDGPLSPRRALRGANDRQ